MAPTAVVADVGVGGGHDDEHLARRGCRRYLADGAARLLRHASERLDRAGLAGQVLGVSARRRRGWSRSPAAAQVVLLLGPLYHLPTLADRRRAVGEAARLLAPGGLVFGAAIDRLAYLRDAYRGQPGQGAPLRQFHAGFLRDGNLDPAHAPPIGFAHLSAVAEFRALFAEAFDEVALVGVESFANDAQDLLVSLFDPTAPPGSTWSSKPAPRPRAGPPPTTSSTWAGADREFAALSVSAT